MGKDLLATSESEVKFNNLSSDKNVMQNHEQNDKFEEFNGIGSIKIE